jgi:hypothetical protein
MDEKDRASLKDDEKTPAEAPKWRQGWVTVDPDSLHYGTVHACAILRKVNDALHGDVEAMAPLSDDGYEP